MLLLEEVCFCNDFVVVYKIFVKVGYKDDEGIENEVDFGFFFFIILSWCFGLFLGEV